MKKLLKDFLTAVLVAGAVGIVAGSVLFIIGLLIGQSVYAGLTTVRSGLLVVGGLLMLASAGVFLKGNNLPSDAFRLFPKGEKETHAAFESSRKIFQCLSRRCALLMIGIFIILFAAGVDEIIFVCF